MRAGVDETVDRAACVADQEHRLAPGAQRVVIPVPGNLALVAAVYPAALEDALDLGLEQVGIGVDVPAHPQGAVCLVNEAAMGDRLLHRLPSPDVPGASLSRPRAA